MLLKAIACSTSSVFGVLRLPLVHILFLSVSLHLYLSLHLEARLLRLLWFSHEAQGLRITT